MAEDWNVISTYTDKQAVEDGVLVSVEGLVELLGLYRSGGRKINRITRAVFAHFTGKLADESAPVVELILRLQPLIEAIRAMIAISPDEDGWVTGEYQGKKLWLVPNEVGGLTLMFPEDY